jgi:hypothetical protein
MTKRESLMQEIEQVPDSFVDEVADFVQFLKSRIVREGLGTAVASESTLRKDWLRPEEDQAWLAL